MVNINQGLHFYLIYYSEELYIEYKDKRDTNGKYCEQPVLKY